MLKVNKIRLIKAGHQADLTTKLKAKSMQKTIILGMSKDFYLSPWIEKNLKECGFDVVNIGFPTKHYKYKNIFERLSNLTRKTFFKDKRFKQKLKFDRYKKDICHKLNDLNTQADYALLIRPDIYPQEFIAQLKSKVKVLIGYQWDGLDRFPIVKDCIPLFHRFYVFDMNDYQKYSPSFPNLFYTTNFYFDTGELLASVTKPKIKDQLFYLGIYDKYRLKILEKIIDELRINNYQKKIIIYSSRKILPRSRHKEITISSRQFSYEENINMVKASSVLIDLRFKAHSGLSFRPFEALCFEKKLITNNAFIMQFDFYCKENIFVIDQDKDDELQAFLSTPYKKIDEKIRHKYSFTNWIHSILELDPYIAIHY